MAEKYRAWLQTNGCDITNLSDEDIIGAFAETAYKFIVDKIGRQAARNELLATTHTPPRGKKGTNAKSA